MRSVILCFFFKCLPHFQHAMQCPKSLYHMDNHIDQVSYVTFEEKVLKWNSTSKTITKNIILIWLFVEEIKTSKIFDKVKNFKGNGL